MARLGNNNSKRNTKMTSEIKDKLLKAIMYIDKTRVDIIRGDANEHSSNRLDKAMDIIQNILEQ